MSRLERLLNLTAALLTASRPLTRSDIRERVPGYPDDEGTATSFRRAFERDKESLRDMGIPVSVQEIEGSDPPVEGYRILREQYALRDPGLEPDELAAIHLAAAAVRLEGLRGNEALWKLGGAPVQAGQGQAGQGQAGQGQAGEAQALTAIPTIPQLVPLFTAVAERRPVTFGYRRPPDTETRTIDPHRL
ncbi:MAG: WYL domain-containing protein, partial [Acidimicrobiales bacterium]